MTGIRGPANHLVPSGCRSGSEWEYCTLFVLGSQYVPEKINGAGATSTKTWVLARPQGEWLLRKWPVLRLGQAKRAWPGRCRLVPAGTATVAGACFLSGVRIYHITNL